MDDDDEVINPDDLPRRILTDFAVYKDDGTWLRPPQRRCFEL